MTFATTRHPAAVLVAATVLSLFATTIPAHATPGGSGDGDGRGSPGYQVAVLGDTPYGAAQRVAFPALVEDVNSDPSVRLVLHAGDVKSGSTKTTAATTRSTGSQPSGARSSRSRAGRQELAR